MGITEVVLFFRVGQPHKKLSRFKQLTRQLFEQSKGLYRQAGRKALMDVLEGRVPSRRPIWLMRQAGRYLPVI